MPARIFNMRQLTVVSACAVLTVAGVAQSVAQNQPARPQQQRAAVRHPDPVPQRETLIRLSRPVTVEFQNQRLGDVITFLREYTTADIEPMWIDDRHAIGLDPEQPVTINVRNVTVLTLIERILEQSRDEFYESSWQMSESGAFQMGPKQRLNRWRRVVVYDINDLLMEIPDFPDVPRIDLNQALQAGAARGGGGGQSPFTGDDDDDRERRNREREDVSREIAELIMEIVETEQWIDNGGDGGSIRPFRGTLIVRAPDYMHRGIAGYRYWPARATVSRMVEGRRYVTLTTDNSISALAGTAVAPVTATAPGGGGR